MTTKDPIAIVGIGCRFPGQVDGPEAFWQLLTDGRDAITEVPPDRWSLRSFYDPDPQKPGKASTRWGGFLDQIDQFDAHFFGISPREADYLDPQQRLLLEVAWEGMEDAGLMPDRLAGQPVGVFMGAFTLDYKILQFQDRALVGTHTAVGSMMTIIAARLAYLFDFRGPCISVDTACSSSLVTVHLACQSLWNGECTLALAGGVNVMVTPDYTIAESKGGFLSPDGRSRAFDSRANGYVRGEGAGIIVLKPLSEAQRDGDPIYALIRGSAINQDGRTKGITVPRPEAQEALMFEAYDRAGVSPGQVQYVEAHGTGTPVGDPIEAGALHTVLSSNRPAGDKCIVGSCKTNIGHLESAAGIAGLIKTALILKNRQIPPHLHFQKPNPEIPFDQMCLRIPTALEPFPNGSELLLAGVNSFGFGGTNAHVVLEAAPPQQPVLPQAENRPVCLLPLSAQTPEALYMLAQKYRDFFIREGAALQIADVAYTAATRRTHHKQRLTLVADSHETLIDQLDAFLAGESRSYMSEGRCPVGDQPKLLFVYTGMGPQWWAMGRQLYEQEPVYRQAVEACDRFFQHQAGWSILAEMLADETDSKMAETYVAQPANAVLQIGLTALWRSWGVVPDAVVGHSVGEVVSAYISGILTLEETMCVVYHRSRLQQTATGKGRMLAVGLSTEAVAPYLDGYDDLVSIAAVNSPSSVTLSGDATALAEIGRCLEEAQIFNKLLYVQVPYHSVMMEPIKEELLASLATLSPGSPTTPVYSTVTGQIVTETAFGADYWWRNVREPVRFADTAAAIIQDGYSLFVEVGPHPVLATPINECLKEQGQTGSLFLSLRRKNDEQWQMLASAGGLYINGYPLAWEQLYPAGRFQSLPTYPWQRERYWAESKISQQIRLGHYDHPLLGRRLSSPQPVWEGELNQHCLAYLGDHRLQDVVVYPGAGYVEMAVAAGRQGFGSKRCLIEQLTFRKAIFLSNHDSPHVQVRLDPGTSGFEIYSRSSESGGPWQLNCSGKLYQIPDGGRPRPFSLAQIRQRCPEEIEADECYRRLQQKGFHYGPAFQGIQQIWHGRFDALARIEMPVELAAQAAEYNLHPALLDASFQAVVAIDTFGQTDSQTAELFMPVGIDRILIYEQPGSHLWSHAHIVEQDSQTIVADIRLLDEAGNLLVDIQGFRAQTLTSGSSVRAEELNQWLYVMAWQQQEDSPDTPPTSAKRAQSGHWIIFADRTGAATALVQQLEADGHHCTTVWPGEMYRHQVKERHYTIDPTNSDDLRHLLAALLDESSHPCHGLVHMWALDAPATAEMSSTGLERIEREGCLTVMGIVQSLSAMECSLPLWLITRGAQPVTADDTAVAVAQSPLWGMGRVIGHQEYVKLWGGLIDLDPAAAADNAAMLAQAIQQPDTEDQIAFRQGRRYVARLVRSDEQLTMLTPRFRVDSSYLITGGLGALGLLTAAWMVQQGAAHLILMSRTPLPPRRQWSHVQPGSPIAARIAAVKQLEAMGATVHIVAADVTNEAALQQFLAQHQDEGWPPIRGVIHSAGQVQDQLLAQMDGATFTKITRPKILGGWALHRAFAQTSLDFFILFSSVASLVAQTGQTNYAAGNAFLDALTFYRRAQGLPALTINWGPWAIGMIKELDLIEHYTRRGMESITPEQGFELLGRLFGYEKPQVAVVAANWPLVLEYYPRIPQQVLHLGSEATETPDQAETHEETIIEQFHNSALEAQEALIQNHLLHLVGKVLRIDPKRLEPEIPLTSLGIDSLIATELRNRIELQLEVNIAVVELLQGLSIDRLAQRVVQQLQAKTAPRLTLDELTANGTPISVESLQKLAEEVDEETLLRLIAEVEKA